METTHTTAGLLADAGAARLRAGAPIASCHADAAHLGAYGAIAQHQVIGDHAASTWTTGVAKPSTFMVLDRKNRPTRPLWERPS